ncbi:hypothetical protein BC834DRAFT_856392 [Gloeopeniophorella convolvens]|nr:hypothetical protein BC834DRAFT_856392 [Gloeopeniophorella convolvens]
MPSSPRATRSQSMPRRSSRLSETPGVPRGPTVYVEIPVRRRSKRKKVDTAPESIPDKKLKRDVAIAEKRDNASSSKSSKGRRAASSARGTGQGEVTATRHRDEKSRASPMEDIRDAEARLAQREALLEKREKTFADYVNSKLTESACTTLERLEASFTCPLCLDIMACPYSLIARACGHSFCAVCLLKWFFSRMHSCGNWHTPVACPICRSASEVPPEVPRPPFTCPFIPGRSLDDLVTSSVEKLRSMTSLAIESRDAPQNSTQTGETAAKIIDSEALSLSPTLLAWGDDGVKRQEWCKKDMEGRDAMKYVMNSWSYITPESLLEVKHFLGV